MVSTQGLISRDIYPPQHPRFGEGWERVSGGWAIFSGSREPLFYVADGTRPIDAFAEPEPQPEAVLPQVDDVVLPQVIAANSLSENIFYDPIVSYVEVNTEPVTDPETQPEEAAEPSEDAVLTSSEADIKDESERG